MPTKPTRLSIETPSITFGARDPISILAAIIRWEKSEQKSISPELEEALRAVDWKILFEAAETEKLSSYVAWASLRCRSQLDEKTIEEWQSRMKRQTIHLGELTSLLGEVSEIFAKNRIRVIPLKGAEFALQNYPHALFRVMGDVDLLLRTEDVSKAMELLREKGFARTRSSLPYRWHSELFDKWTHITDTALGRQEISGPRGSIDLHWDPLYFFESLPVRLKVDLAFAEARPQSGFGGGLLVPSDRFFAAHLVVHGTHTGMEMKFRLSTLLDLVLVCERTGLGAKDLMEVIETPEPVEVEKLIRRILDAAWAFSRGDLEPWRELNRRQYRMPSLARTSFDLFKRIGSTRDRALFLLGYLVRTKR